MIHYGDNNATKDIADIRVRLAVLGNGIPGGGVENKIYVWHADGSALDIFDPTEAGVNAALTAAAMGDTVIGPSINIAMTAPITIPASVVLTGISYGFTLTFTGFSGAAIVLSASSRIVGFTLNHADGIGFSVSTISAMVDRMIITASIPGVGGAAPVMREIWAATSNLSPSTDAIYYTGDLATWIKITIFPGAGGDGIKHFFMSPDRKYGYLWKHSGAGDSGVDPVYVFPGSDTKDPASLVLGDFTKIASYGDTIGGTVIGGVGAGITWLQPYGEKLLMAFNPGGEATRYSDYDPVSNTWSTAAVTTGLSQVTRVMYQCYIKVTGGSPPTQSHRLISTLSDAPISFAWFDDGNTNHNHRPFQNLIGGHRYTLRDNGSPLVNYLRDIDGASDVISSLSDAHIDNGVVCGAYHGPQVYYLGDDGLIWSSDDGAVFTNIATWGGLTDNHGFVWDESLVGGGSLVVFRKVAPGSGVLGRVYSRAGTVLTDLTNNFWSLISGQQSIVNVQLGYG